MKYRQLQDGDHIDVTTKGIGMGSFNIACCDCGLVHNVLVFRERGKVVLYLYRDKRRTSSYRRHHKDLEKR